MNVIEKLTEFAEEHPQLLLAVTIGITVLFIAVMAWPTMKSFVGGKKEPLSNKEEVKKLIESINQKQGL